MRGGGLCGEPGQQIDAAARVGGQVGAIAHCCRVTRQVGTRDDALRLQDLERAQAVDRFEQLRPASGLGRSTPRGK